MKPIYVKKNGEVNKISGIVNPSSYSADDITYDGSTSGLTADDVQEAIDEIVDGLGTAASKNVGVSNGVAELDSSGKVPSSQLPSYVDDVIEVDDYAHLPITGESGKIYVTKDTNKTYRWSGTGYIEISESLALGETSETAYRGDRGKTAYDHATETKLSTATASGLYKVAGTAQGHIASLTAVEKSDITALGIPGSDTNTHRPIQVNGTQNLGDNTTALNLKNGTNITVTADGGNVTIATSAEVNQNAFSNVKVGSTTVAADSKTDTLELVAGSNVTITPDATNDKVTIAATDTNTHRPIQVNGTEILGNNTTALNLKAGSNVSLTNSSGTVTIAATDTNTTYTVATGDGNGQIKVTPSSGSAYNVDVKGLGSNAYTSTAFLPLSGGTMTGDIIFNKTGATDLTQVQMKCGVNDYGRVAAGGTASNSGWMEIATADDGAEPIYARQYSGVYTSIVRTATLLDASGNTSFPGILSLSKTVRKMLTGTGTAAQDKGSGVSPRYFPAKWAFNIGIATPADGDIVTIKIPVAGHDFGTFLSLDNGTTYKPISVDYGTGRLTTHYGASRPITLIYDSSGGTNSVFAAAGADARSNITGGCWRVMNFWDSGNTYDRNRFNANIMAWGTKILNGNIIVGINGLYHHLKEGTAFDITYPILYLNGDCNASAATTNTYDIIHFTSTTTQNTSWTAYKPVYIKGSLSGNTFTPISTTPLLQTVPTSEDNYYYMLLGMATGSTTIYLQNRHPIFAYKYNQFAEIAWNSQFTSFLKPVAANTTASFSNWSIPSGSYQVWGQGWTDNRLKYTPSGGTETTVTDSGDWTMWLSGNGTGNVAEFNMRIDGTYYGKFNGNLSGNASSATSATKAIQDESGNNIKATYAASFSISDHTITLKNKNGASLGTVTVPDNNTLNTAGATDTSSKIFLIGATSQAANPQTYSDNEVYATSGVLTTKSVQVGGTAATMQYNSTTKSIDFVFA